MPLVPLEGGCLQFVYGDAASGRPPADLAADPNAAEDWTVLYASLLLPDSLDFVNLLPPDGATFFADVRRMNEPDPVLAWGRDALDSVARINEFRWTMAREVLSNVPRQARDPVHIERIVRHLIDRTEVLQRRMVEQLREVEGIRIALKQSRETGWVVQAANDGRNPLAWLLLLLRTPACLLDAICTWIDGPPRWYEYGFSRPERRCHQQHPRCLLRWLVMRHPPDC